MARFFQGRCGIDAIGKCTSWFAIIMLLCTMIFHFNTFYILALVALIYSYWRMMSKNVAKRYQENQRFLMHTERIRFFFKGIRNKIKKFFSKAKYDSDQRKIYAIFRCPSCNQKLRAPKGRGRIEVTCRNCHTTFIKKV